MLLRLLSWLQRGGAALPVDASSPSAVASPPEDASSVVAAGPTLPPDEEDPPPPVSGVPRPPGMSIEAHVERQIEAAQRSGRFKGLRGAGKPLPDLETHDELWWVRRKLADEGVEVPLPPALQLKRELAEELARIRLLDDEGLVRAALLRLNDRIRATNARAGSGPASTVGPLDVEAWLERRRREDDSPHRSEGRP